MKKLFLLLAFCGFVCNGYAQHERILTGPQASQAVPNAELVRYVARTPAPAYIRLRPGYEVPMEKANAWLKQVLGMGAQDAFEPMEETPDQLGQTHTRMRQTFAGLPVESGMYLLHAANGFILSANGEFYPGIALNVNPSLPEASALQVALQHVGATHYRWQDAQEEEGLKRETGDSTATYYPHGTLVVVHPNGNPRNGAARLAWKFDIYASAPLYRAYVYIDAHDSEVVWEHLRIHNADVVGTAITAYSGTRTITADYTGTTYRLRETGRGNGIRTYDMNTGTNYGAAVDFTDANNVWNNVNAQRDEVATDAHWGAEMTYDYFYLVHGRNSIDGNGFALVSYVHYDQNYVNAFWDGQRMTYGDGNGTTFLPLTGLDVTGHEIGHGLTTFTADLVYQDEPGALNESFSDIFGNTIEHYARPTQWSWKIGEDFSTNGNGFRSMQNPNAYGDPDTYTGTNWYTGTADNGGVHTNSGVQNKWYYILVTGETGTNDLGNAYSVTGQGWTVGGAIAFRNLTIYLTTNSDYADARFYSIQAATDLYGPCTPEVIATTNAWYAVGVGPQFTNVVTAAFTANSQLFCSPPATVQFTNQSTNGGSYTWLFGDGGTSTAFAPQHTYTALGNYTVTLIANGGACGNDTTVMPNFISVDTNNNCTVTLPPNGTATTQTSCSGTVYDPGGPTGIYASNQHSQVTLAPLGAATVSLTFSTFNVEAGSTGTVCDYDYVSVYNGPSTASPLIGKYCNNNLPPAVINSTGGALTLVFHSDGGVELAGFVANWQCVLPTTPPVVQFTANNLTSCNGNVQFTDQTTNGPTSWLWNFGDGFTSTQQHPLHTYTTNGVYTVTLTATNNIGNNTLVKTSYITVNKPAGPTASGASRCGPGTLSLSATGGGTFKWYDAATGGTQVGTGGAFTTPVLTNSVVYYVQAETPAPSQYVGPVNPAAVGGGGYHNNGGDQYLTFTVFSSLTLVSVYVDPGAAGNRTIRLWDGNGNLLRDTTMNITAPTQRITLNWAMAPGDYRIGGANMDMYRNNAGAAFPYNIANLVRITGSSAGSAFYYYFYDWEVKGQPCVSLRTPVPATINTPSTVTVTPLPTAGFCPGGSITLTASGANTYQWSTGATGATLSVNTAGNYYALGTDANTCVDTSNIVAVSQLVPQVAITPSGSTSLCPGDSVTLTASAGTNYVWNTTATTQSIVVNSTNTYTVNMTDVNGCAGTANITITVGSSPPVNITPSGSTALCEGDSITLTATAGVSYLWSNSATSQSIVVSSPGTFTVAVAFAGSCSGASAPTTVTVNPLPTADVSVSNGLAFCAGGSTDLSASGGTDFLWTGGSTQSTLPVSTSGTYTVTVTDANGCEDDTAVTVTVYPLPTASITASNGLAFCEGSSTDLSASGGTDYLWTGGSTQPTLPVSTSGTYTVTVTDANGCEDDTTVPVTVNPLPTVAFTPITSPVCDTLAALSLSATPAGGVFTGIGINGADFEPSVAGLGTHILFYTYTDGNGCANADSVSLQVDVCTSTAEGLAWGNVTLYPNPNNGQFVLEGLPLDTPCQLLDATGRSISTFYTTAPAQAVEIPNVVRGVYILRVGGATGYAAFRVVVQ